MAAHVRPAAGAGHGCLLCGTGPLLPDGRARPKGTPRSFTHRGRGLCVPCHEGEVRAGRLEQWPRLARGAVLLAEAGERMHRQWWAPSWPEVADELEVPFGTLMNAVYRHRRAQ